MLQGLKTAVVVVVLSCLIWVFAERSKTQTVSVALEVTLANSGELLVQYLDNRDKPIADNSRRVKLVLEGPTSRIQKVTEAAEKVSRLVADVSAASGQQATGIDQVNQTVGEMNTVVQQNAASAEESASVVEGMNAQATQITVIVTDLVSLVDGSRTADFNDGGLQAETRTSRRLEADNAKTDQPESVKLLTSRTKKNSPGVNSGGDSDFSDF